MKTIEAAYIFPIILAITGAFIILIFRIHDATISQVLQYGLLIDQSISLENRDYGTYYPLSSSDIADTIYDSLLVGQRPSFYSCLSGDSLYLKDNTTNATVSFSNFELCNTLRKETVLLQHKSNEN